MKFTTIRPETVNEYVAKPGTVLVDLRDRKAFIKQHLPRAVNIPYEGLEKQRRYLRQFQSVILYCDRGNTSLLAARDLEEEPFSVYHVHGGIQLWKTKGKNP